MEYLTNAHKEDADTVIRQLCVGWVGRRIIEGDPQPTEASPADYLKSQGMVGLYEVCAGRAVS